MGLKKLQEEISDWSSQFSPPYWPVHNQFYRLAEEVGEVGRELNHIDGTKKKKSNELPDTLGDELADIVFTVICMANSQNIDLDASFRKMMDEKIHGRDKDRYGSDGKSKPN